MTSSGAMTIKITYLHLLDDITTINILYYSRIDLDICICV